MPKNKPRENKKGFLLFQLEFYKNELDKGNDVTLEKAKLETLPIWPKLQKSERQKYEEKAENIDLTRWLNDCITRDKARLKEIEDKKAREVAQVKRFLENVFGSEDWDEHVFVLFSVAHFVKTEKSIFPGEIALAKFSLKEGIIATKQLRIDPGALPTGTFNDAQLTAQETHQMPLPPDCGGEKDWTKIKRGFKKFLGNDDQAVVFVKQYPKCQDLDAAQKTLEKIWQGEDNGAESAELVPLVCALDKLLYQMAEKSGKEFESVENAREFLEKNSISADGCDYHEHQDVLFYCCLARVKQWAYAISQRCLDVDSLVLGKHLPVPIEVKKEEEEIADLMLTAEDTDDSFDSECDDFSSGSDTIKIEEEFALLPSFENSLVGQRYKQETDFETIDESSEKFSNDSNQTEKVEPELQVTSFDLDSFKTFF